MHQTLLLLVVVLLGISIVDVSVQSVGISVEPNDTTICKGGNALLNCGYFINIPVMLTPQWRINGTTLLNMNDIDNDTDDLLQWIEDDNNTNTTRLLVGPVDENYVGSTTFRCEIPITPPDPSRTATLTVIGTAPTPPITDIDIEMNNITISWTITDYDPGNVCGTVLYRVKISGLDFNGMDTTSADMYTFTGLTPNTNYTITVTPYNNAGDGTPASIEMMTMPTVPLPPTDVQLNLKFDKRTPNISASWMAPRLESTMTEVEEYNLTLYINGSSQATTIVPANTTMVDIFSVFGPNIARERYTNYLLSVAAINSAGMGEFRQSEVVTRYIQGGEPTSGVGMITISCIPASSVPPVRCTANYMCGNESAKIVNNLNDPFIIETTQACNINITVVSGLDTLDQETYTNVVPDVQRTITTATITIPGPTPTMPAAQPSMPDDDNDDTGSIVGAVIGALACVGLIVLIILCICWCRYRRRRKLALIPCAIKCSCCACLLCAYCAKKRSGSMKPMTASNDKTDTGNSNSSGNSPDSPKSTDAFVVNYKKENIQPEAGYCEVASKKQVKHDNGITSEYSVVGSGGNPTKNAPQPVALYSEIGPVPKKNGLVPATSVPSQYSMITQEEDTDTNNTVEGMPMYSQVYKSKKTIRVQQLPEYSIVHKPTKAEGKVDNYTDLADIGPYPAKRPPQDKVQYTEVTPSDATTPDSGTQYTNVDHINDRPIHLSTDLNVQYSVVQ
ncbi:protein sidekick-2-like isoform X2 [Dysidea avara]